MVTLDVGTVAGGGHTGMRRTDAAERALTDASRVPTVQRGVAGFAEGDSSGGIARGNVWLHCQQSHLPWLTSLSHSLRAPVDVLPPASI